MVFVCAAGNNILDLIETPIYTAVFYLYNVIVVYSANDDMSLSYFSNLGSEVNITAQG